MRARLCLALALSSLTLGALASAAWASTASVSGGVLTYTGDLAKPNSIQGTESAPGQVDLQPGYGVEPPTAGAGCSASGGIVSCTGVTSVVATGGNRDDFMSFGSISTLPVTLAGGGGNDNLSGGDGKDTLTGGTGDDGLYPNGGDDTADGGPGADTIRDDGIATPSQSNNDVLSGGDGDDRITGGDGTDTLEGGAGDDELKAGMDGITSISGGSGDDTVYAAPDGTPDTFTGGAGVDLMSYTGDRSYDQDVNVSLDGVANDGTPGENDNVAADFENLVGGHGNDTLTGNGGANSIFGSDGNDTINAGGGDDSLYGGSGDDVLAGGDGNDTLQGDNGDDTLNGGSGDDTLRYDSGADVFNGGAGTDTVDGGTWYTDQGLALSLDGQPNDGIPGEGDNIDADRSVENVIGSSGNDTITGNAGVNLLSGGDGNDTINGKDGTLLVDSLACGDGYDRVTIDQFDSFSGDGFARGGKIRTAPFGSGDGSQRCESVAPPARIMTTPKLSFRSVPGRRGISPYRVGTGGQLDIGMVPADLACGSGQFVTVRVTAGKKVISSRRAVLDESCNYLSSVSFKHRARFGGHRALTVVVTYAGSRYIWPAAGKPVRVRVV